MTIPAAMPTPRPAPVPASLGLIGTDRPPRGIEAIHREVDERARALAVLHRDRLLCRRGCCACCVDEITVFEVEADRIRRHHADLLATGDPHPPGACAFLDGPGACRVFEDRPYVCRTQGLPLRWMDVGPEGQEVELRDICPLNVPGPAIEELPADACWEIGPIETRLAALQAKRDGGPIRVRLRDLFAAHPRGSAEPESA